MQSIDLPALIPMDFPVPFDGGAGWIRMYKVETYKLVTVSVHNIRKSLLARPRLHDCFITVSNEFREFPRFLPLPLEL